MFKFSGKTAILSTLSEKYNIIELHPGECRSGSQIKQKIGDACTSRRLQLNGDFSCSTVLKTKRKKTKKQSKVKDFSMPGSLIHIEHPEINFVEDTSMFSSMSQLIRRSKIPVVITTNDFAYIKDALCIPVTAKVIECSLPSLDYCTYRILLLLSCSSTKILDKSLNLENLVISIENLVRQYNFDIRKILACISSFAKIHESINDKCAPSVTNKVENKFFDQPMIVSIEPKNLPRCGGEAVVRYSGCINIEYVFVNGKKSLFKQIDESDSIRVQIPACSHLEQDTSKEFSSQLDDLDRRVRYSNRFAEVVLVSSYNGILSRSDRYSDHFFLHNVRNIDPEMYERHRKWNIMYDLSSPDGADSVDFKRPSTILPFKVNKKVRDHSICNEFEDIISRSDEVMLLDLVEMGG